MTREAWGGLAVLIAATLWGTTGTAAAMAPALSPIAIGAAAMGIGGLIQAALAAPQIGAQRHALWAAWLLLLLGAAAVAIYPLAFYASMRLAGVTVGTVVSIGAAPLFSAMIEALHERRAPERRWLVGAGLGLAGLILLALEKGQKATPTAAAPSVGAMPPDGTGDALAVFAGADPMLAGLLLGLVAAFTYAFFTWTARRVMLSGVSAGASMGATFGLGGLALMPVLGATGAGFLQAEIHLWVGIYMALGPMVLGYLAFGYGLARIPASAATTLTLWEPVVAALLAVAILGERLSGTGWVGVLLVVGCLLVLTMRAAPRASTAKA